MGHRPFYCSQLKLVNGSLLWVSIVGVRLKLICNLGLYFLMGSICHSPCLALRLRALAVALPLPLAPAPARRGRSSAQTHRDTARCTWTRTSVRSRPRPTERGYSAARKPEQLTWQELREQGAQGACRCRLARLDLRRRRHGHHRSTPAEVIVRLHHPKRRLRDRRDVLQRVVAAIYGLMVANNPQGSRRREVGSNIQELRSIPPLASEGRIAAGSTDGGIACYRTRSAPRC
jgi:hypothetical protein